MTKSISLSIQGDAGDPNQWSGTAYYCGQALKKFTDLRYLKNEPIHAAGKKILWRLTQSLTGKSPYGFQYSEMALEHLNEQIMQQHRSDVLISFNQLLPTATALNRVVYYIDATLAELFKSESYGLRISEKRKAEILAIERENYHQAEQVWIMGSWLRGPLEEYYNVPSEKIKHVLPGANISEKYLAKVSSTDVLCIGFVAKDYKRKGLFYVLDLVQCLIDLGVPAKLLMVGECPNDIAQKEEVEFLGFINKKEAPEAWQNFLDRCHFGALFSQEEALGISLLEFLSAGIPVMGFYHQGMMDTLMPEVSFRSNKEDAPEILAKKIRATWTSTAYADMRKKAVDNSDYCLWDRAAQEMMKHLA